MHSNSTAACYFLSLLLLLTISNHHTNFANFLHLHVLPPQKKHQEQHIIMTHPSYQYHGGWLWDPTIACVMAVPQDQAHIRHTHTITMMVMPLQELRMMNNPSLRLRVRVGRAGQFFWHCPVSVTFLVIVQLTCHLPSYLIHCPDEQQQQQLRLGWALGSTSWHRGEAISHPCPLPLLQWLVSILASVTLHPHHQQVAPSTCPCSAFPRHGTTIRLSLFRHSKFLMVVGMVVEST